MPAARTQAGGCGSSHSTQLGSLPWSICPVFPPRCSQALCSSHPQCSTSALALSRGRGRLGCCSACCAQGARGPSLSRATVVRTLGGPAWFGRLLSVEGGQMAEAARSHYLYSAWVVVRRPSPPRSVTALVSPFQLPGPHMVTAGL